MSKPPTPEPGDEMPDNHSPSEGSSPVLNNARSVITRTTNEDYIFPKKSTGDGGTHTPENSCTPEKNNLEGSDSTVESKNSKHSRKRSVPSSEMAMHDGYEPKRPRPEISGIIRQAAAILNEESSVNPDYWMDMSGTRGPIELDNSRSIGISLESRDIEKSHSQNPGVQVQENFELQKSLTTEQSSVPNKNISNKDLPANVSDSFGPKRETVISIGNVLAVPGPSHPHENVPQPKLSRDYLQNQSEQFIEEMKEMEISSACHIRQDIASNNYLPNSKLSISDLKKRLIEQSVEEMMQLSVCAACHEKHISEHDSEIEGNLLFGCCRCFFFCEKDIDLMSHICEKHVPEPYFCNICKVRYAEVGSHDYEHTCDVDFCRMKFQCITQLEDHYSVHNEYFSKICRICKHPIDIHRFERDGILFYKCCRFCPKEFDNKWSFRNHLLIHSKLKLYKCDFCQRRFSLKTNVVSHYQSHPKCEICKETFMFKHSLEEHYMKEHL